MKFFYLSIIAVLLVSILIFTGCDSSPDDDVVVVNALAVGDTLTLTGTITHVFVPPPTDTWDATYANAAGSDYLLINENDDSTLATDANGVGETDLSLSYGTPDPGELYFPSVANLTSSNADAKIFTARIEVDNIDGDYITYGNYSDPYVWYTYWYSTHDTTLNGVYTDPGDGSTYTISNVSISSGWNLMNTTTANGTDLTYLGGTISGPQWTSD